MLHTVSKKKKKNREGDGRNGGKYKGRKWILVRNNEKKKNSGGNGGCGDEEGRREGGDICRKCAEMVLFFLSFHKAGFWVKERVLVGLEKFLFLKKRNISRKLKIFSFLEFLRNVWVVWEWKIIFQKKRELFFPKGVFLNWEGGRGTGKHIPPPALSTLLLSHPLTLRKRTPPYPPPNP